MVRDFLGDMVGGDEVMRVSGDKVHTVNPQEIHEDGSVRHNDWRACMDHAFASLSAGGLSQLKKSLSRDAKRLA